LLLRRRDAGNGGRNSRGGAGGTTHQRNIKSTGREAKTGDIGRENGFGGQKGM
jgi:hypothetical protein